MKKLIEGITAEEARQEIAEWIEDEYRFGRSIDRKRIRDLRYTIEVLESK